MEDDQGMTLSSDVKFKLKQDLHQALVIIKKLFLFNYRQLQCFIANPIPPQEQAHASIPKITPKCGTFVTTPEAKTNEKTINSAFEV